MFRLIFEHISNSFHFYFTNKTENIKKLTKSIIYRRARSRESRCAIILSRVFLRLNNRVFSSLILSTSSSMSSSSTALPLPFAARLCGLPTYSTSSFQFPSTSKCGNTNLAPLSHHPHSTSPPSIRSPASPLAPNSSSTA